jgi:hypothetical protein
MQRAKEGEGLQGRGENLIAADHPRGCPGCLGEGPKFAEGFFEPSGQ